MPAEKKWLAKRHIQDNHKLVLQCTIFNRKVHGSITDYVDDVYNKLLVESNKAADAKKKWQESNDCFDECLAESGYKQNTTKQVVMPALRDMKENKALYSMLPCEVKPTARYLGPLVSSVPSLTLEREVRIKTANIGWNSMGAYWFSKTSKKLKRMIFIGKVVQGLISGLTAIIVNATDLKQFDSCIIKKVRAMMQQRRLLQRRAGTSTKQ